MKVINDLNKKYSGVWPVMVTPFGSDGKIDFDCYDGLLRWYMQTGVNGMFAVCGSSEMDFLEQDECVALASATVKTCAGKIPVVATASLGDNFNLHLSLAGQLEEVGVDAIVLVAPDFCDGEMQLEEYFLQMADSVSCDVGIYEMPLREYRNFSLELLQKLSQTGKFRFIKETSCCLETICKKIEICQKNDLTVLQANTAFLSDSIESGAAGLMGVVANILPSTCLSVCCGGSKSQDVSILHSLLCLADALLVDPYPASGKYMLNKIGFNISTRSRKNTQPLSDAAAKMIDCGLKYILEQTDELIKN